MNNKKTFVNHEEIMDQFVFSFPETPELFKQAVQKTVEKNLYQKQPISRSDNDYTSTTDNTHNRTWKTLKVVTASLCILIIGVVVYSAESAFSYDQFSIDDRQVEKSFTSETTTEKTSDKIISIPEQTIEIDSRTTARVINSTISPSGIILNIQFITTSDYSNKSSRNYNSTKYYVEDSNGNRKLLIGYPGDAARSVKLGVNWSADIDDFDTDSEYIKMIPYTIPGNSITSNYIPGTEIMDEEHSFIIRLK